MHMNNMNFADIDIYQVIDLSIITAKESLKQQTNDDNVNNFT